MSCGQVKNSLIVYVSLTRTSYLITGQVKILMYLPGRQVKIFRFFYPCRCTLFLESYATLMHDHSNCSKLTQLINIYNFFLFFPQQKIHFIVKKLGKS